MYRKLDDAGAADRDLSSIRIWASGADVMPQDLIRRFKSMGASISVPLLGSVGEAAFVEGYGMVEVGGGVAAKVSPPMVPLSCRRWARHQASRQSVPRRRRVR